MTVLVAKRAIKRTAGLLSVVLSRMHAPATGRAACILVYHRVNRHAMFDPFVDDWNVTPDRLDRHVGALSQDAEFVFLHELPERLASGDTPRKPIVCLTFDDGYENFCTEALPILQRHQAKATAFVVTGYIGRREPMPFDRWGLRHAARAPASAWRPMGWREIDACVGSGLVEIGGHSHRHGNASRCHGAQLLDEAERSRETLRRRLGPPHASSYAYPYGCSRLGEVPAAYLAAVRHSGFARAVSTDLGLATPASDPYRLPRIEVYRSDGPAVLRAKAAGSLSPFVVTDRLRRDRR